MKIIGIDQSYSCTGICVLKNSNLIHSEIYKTSKTLDIFERANTIANHILTLAYDYKPKLIGIEGLAFGMRGDATRDLAGLQFTIINKLRFVADFKVEIVAPNAVKKFATGNGKAKKDAMFESLPSYVKKTFLDLGVKKSTGLYDLTDAFWVGKLVDSTV